MSQKPETVFRGKVRKWLKDELPNAWFESIQQQAIAGTPDILGCVAGRFVALELKASERSDSTEMQRLKIQRINDAGGVGLFVFPENWYWVQAQLIRVSKGAYNGIETS